MREAMTPAQRAARLAIGVRMVSYWGPLLRGGTLRLPQTAGGVPHGMAWVGRLPYSLQPLVSGGGLNCCCLPPTTLFHDGAALSLLLAWVGHASLPHW